jgi:hypothetical protein
MDSIVFNAPQPEADGYLTGSFVPKVRPLSLPALVGAQPLVFDASVPHNWNTVDQVLDNLTIDANGSGSGYSVANVMFDGAAHFQIRHVTLIDLAHEGESLSIWNSAFFAVDDVVSRSVWQGPTVIGASYDFTMSNIKTIGFWDSGAAVIAGPVAGVVTPNYAPLEGTWNNIETDGSLVMDGRLGGSVGFDAAAGIKQRFENFRLFGSTVHGLNIHVNLGTPGGWISPAGYIDAKNIEVAGNSGLYGGIYIDGASEVNCTNCQADQDGQYGVYVEGDEVSDGLGGYVDAKASGIRFYNIHASNNVQDGAIVASQQTLHGTVATVKDVEFENGVLNNGLGTQRWGLLIAQPFGLGTVDYVSSVNVLLSPNAIGTVWWDGIEHHKLMTENQSG